MRLIASGPATKRQNRTARKMVTPVNTYNTTPPISPYFIKKKKKLQTRILCCKFGVGTEEVSGQSAQQQPPWNKFSFPGWTYTGGFYLFSGKVLKTDQLPTQISRSPGRTPPKKGRPSANGAHQHPIPTRHPAVAHTRACVPSRYTSHVFHDLRSLVCLTAPLVCGNPGPTADW